MTVLQHAYGTNVARADVSDPNDLLAVVATWPEVWQDSFAEREAIMAIDASHPCVTAMQEAFKDVVRVAVLRTRPPVGEEGEKVGDADVASRAQPATPSGMVRSGSPPPTHRYRPPPHRR